MTNRISLAKKALIGSIGFLVIAWWLGSDARSGNLWEGVRSSLVPTARIAGEAYALEIADTDSERQRGLSGREDLCERCGMLFVFDTPDRYAFWMKDMRFPLDIVWLSGDTVVFVAHDVLPDSSAILMPPALADQVLEINAGKGAGLSPGEKIVLSSGILDP